MLPFYFPVLVGRAIGPDPVNDLQPDHQMTILRTEKDLVTAVVDVVGHPSRADPIVTHAHGRLTDAKAGENGEEGNVKKKTAFDLARLVERLRRVHLLPPQPLDHGQANQAGVELAG